MGLISVPISIHFDTTYIGANGAIGNQRRTVVLNINPFFGIFDKSIGNYAAATVSKKNPGPVAGSRRI